MRGSTRSSPTPASDTAAPSSASTESRRALAFSPWESYIDASERGTLSTNILVLGAYRSGKSATIKTLTTRSIAFGHQVVVPSDPKGEWVTVAEAIPGGRVIRLGGGGTGAG